MSTAQKDCGACRHWEAGQCFRFPPQMVSAPWGNQIPIEVYYPAPYRPEVLATERGCGEWSPAA